MTKAELLSYISTRLGVEKSKVNQFFETFQSLILDSLVSKGEFSLLELGKLKVVKKAERRGMNPLTRSPIVIPATNSPKMVFSRRLKDLISGKIKREDF